MPSATAIRPSISTRAGRSSPSRSAPRSASARFSKRSTTRSNATDNLDLIVGAFYYDDKLDYGKGGGQSYAGSVDPAGLLRTQFVFLTSKAYALYADATYTIGDNLFLTGGVRYNHEKRGVRYFEIPGVVTAPSLRHRPNRRRSSRRRRAPSCAMKSRRGRASTHRIRKASGPACSIRPCCPSRRWYCRSSPKS